MAETAAAQAAAIAQAIKASGTLISLLGGALEIWNRRYLRAADVLRRNPRHRLPQHLKAGLRREQAARSGVVHA